MIPDNYEPRYVISVAARMLGVPAHTLRYYERAGVVQPSRSTGNIRLYSDRDIERLRQARRLVDDLGVNLAGVEVIINMTDRLTEMQHQIDEMESKSK